MEKACQWNINTGHRWNCVSEGEMWPFAWTCRKQTQIVSIYDGRTWKACFFLHVNIMHMLVSNVVHIQKLTSIPMLIHSALYMHSFCMSSDWSRTKASSDRCDYPARNARPFTFTHTCAYLRGLIQKFPDWPLGARTANVQALYH